LELGEGAAESGRNIIESGGKRCGIQGVLPFRGAGGRKRFLGILFICLTKIPLLFLGGLVWSGLELVRVLRLWLRL